MIRDYQESDLVWIKPLAEKFGEWEAVQQILGGPYEWAMVIEPLAIVCLVKDSCGCLGVGLADREGMKALHELALKAWQVAEERNIPVHTHVAPGTWQYEFFKRLGFTPGKVGTLSIGE